MSIHPGQQDEYVRRHQPIWRELEDTLRVHGVHTYTIFLDKDTNDLFAYVEFESEERWQAVAATDVCRRWWRHMREVMPTTDEETPVTQPLHEVFHIDSDSERP